MGQFSGFRHYCLQVHHNINRFLASHHLHSNPAGQCMPEILPLEETSQSKQLNSPWLVSCPGNLLRPMHENKLLHPEVCCTRWLQSKSLYAQLLLLWRVNLFQSTVSHLCSASPFKLGIRHNPPSVHSHSKPPGTQNAFRLWSERPLACR